ncbi:hypothetical protein EPI10_028806 [Gossypium australe]|uniref:Uncharacterized protein n=1 Tax=Gossypium australe TaxID=47621 RepID=A0A5B6UXJ3_9ROSI|nr:hypothetical protein EPI10_028806 [Gossypium australe]
MEIPPPYEPVANTKTIKQMNETDIFSLNAMFLGPSCLCVETMEVKLHIYSRKRLRTQRTSRLILSLYLNDLP